MLLGSRAPPQNFGGEITESHASIRLFNDVRGLMLSPKSDASQHSIDTSVEEVEEAIIVRLRNAGDRLRHQAVVR
jgi:hypothetical protein